jgi:hypothetical protein
MRRTATLLCLLSSSAAMAAGGFTLPESVGSTAPAAYDAFGSDVAVHGGGTLVVGVRGADVQGANAGAIEIFGRAGGAWSFVARPAATGLAAGDQLGESVAVTADWIIAGGPRHDTSGADAGAAWVFRRNGTEWSHAQRLLPAAGSAGARFGTSVAASPEALAVGAPVTASGGSVTTYRLQAGAWVALTTLVNPTPAAGDRFGDAVALTDSVMAVGAPFDDTAGPDAGAVHIYVRTPLNWAYSSTLLPATGAPSQHFGQSVALSGSRLAVGAYGADTGAYQSGRVDVFDAVGTVWTRTASIVPGFPVDGGNFGWDVALDGGSLAVGAPGAGATAFAGEVAVFARNADATWTAVAEGGLVDAEAQDLLGTAVAIAGGQFAASAPLAHASVQYRGLVGAADLSADCDGNGVADFIDLAAGAADCDSDGVLDACEPNADGDALPDDCDGCPTDPLKISPGACGCGVVDVDSDSDGTADCNDGCPTDPLKIEPGACGCGVADTDTDSDGTPDCDDDCPTDPLKIAPGTCGCGAADTDSDSDGAADCIDGCPADPLKTSPGDCGCGVADTDSDNDGTADCDDDCPTDPLKTSPGTCGCGVADTDSDSDGAEDCIDGCPTDPLKTSPGACGCGVADTDSDNDGTADCDDDCPTDPLKTSPGTCGCGVADTDTDADGTPDCIDGCPTAPGDVCDLIFEVPGEFPTIQAAIDAAPADQATLVLVAAGTYNESFALLGKDVVVRGATDGDTILSGVGLNTSIARFSGGEPATAGLENLIFRLATSGSRITPQSSFTVGGALFGSNSAAFIRACGFEQCGADFGGAVYLLRSAISVQGCTFLGNTAQSEGGGMLVYESTGTVADSVFQSNRCGLVGPGSGSGFKSVGARQSGESVVLTNCAFLGGTAGVSGAAVEHFENNPQQQSDGVRGILRLVDCLVQGNASTSGAAGLRILGTVSACSIESGTLICANTPSNVSGPYFNDGTAGVCDCLADITGDGVVNGSDLGILLSSWGPVDAMGTGDVTHNNTVDAADLAIVLSAWGACVPQ